MTNKLDNSDAPMFGVDQKSPDELIAEQKLIRESAINKLIGLGLTEQEAWSIITLDISQ